ncbi:apolipoprotein N-acyltransferase [Uliginosibacterium sp. TH139]|uniref:apolipoprotein N-acyltransferase n=1 Tax=Uliginosibacterium sp. TH139 TaxID=2067453 RepID=UPI000C7CD934|nr:apolipoprotein N-acyltransferase [Uliginosibacterium sp. TH139]PLK49163.1 apolipoprotein N-acyltransferase [Uliginosibacterium sp. TH139]
MSFLIALLAGAASVLAYAPFEQFWLMPLSWGVLYFFLRQPDLRPGRAFLTGWAWGSGALFAGLCWLVVALNRFGGLSAPLAVFLILLFCCALALYPALLSALFARLRPAHWVGRVVLMAACWTLCELLRGQVFPAFPWLAIGYTQTPPSPLAGWAAVLGVYGMTFLLAATAALLVEAWREPVLRRRALAWALLPWLAGAGLRQIEWSAPVGAPVSVSLIQTNVAQDQKWRADTLMAQLQLNAELLARYPARIMVLPESSLPLFVDQLPQGFLEHIEQQARGAGGDAILGVFTSDAAGGVFNSAITRGSSAPQQYSKNHLVPFGEFRPWGFGWFFDLANIPMANQTPGGDHQPLLELAGQKVAMNICYEDVFGEELRRALPEATLMLNISNLAWYGDSHAQPQHLQMSRIRALESGRPQLRSTNTGMTAIVLPDATVSAVLPAFTQGALQAEVRGYQGVTPFVLLGDWPIWLLVWLVLLGALIRKRRLG